MNRTFNTLPIKTKLFLIILSACAVALLLATIVTIGSQWYITRKNIDAEFRSLGKVIAHNSQAALVFGDTKSLSDTLASLAAKPTVAAARIFDPAGVMLAEFEAMETPPAAVTPRDEKNSGQLGLLDL